MEEPRQPPIINPTSQRLVKFSFVMVLLCCLLTFGYGLAALLEKQPQPLLFQLTPIDHFMAFITGLAFCVASLGLLAILFRINYLAGFTVIFLFAVSFLAITRHVLKIVTAYDPSLSWLVLRLEYWSVMRPITAVCFLMICSVFVYLMRAKKSNQTFTFVSMQAVIILCLAILFSFGYSLQITNTSLQYLTLISTNSATALFFLSTGIIFAVIYLDKKRPQAFNKLLPILIAGFVGVLSLVFWRLLDIENPIIRILGRGNWLVVVEEIVIALLVGMAIYFFIKTYLYHKKYQRMYATVKGTLNATHDGILVINFKEKIIDYNKQFLQLWGLSPPQLFNASLNSVFDLLASRLENVQEISPMRIKNKSVKPGTQELHLQDGRVYEFYFYRQPYVGYVLSFYDITHLKQTQEKLAYQATHDALTNLPNRFLLFEHIEKGLAYANRENTLLAILFIDLDRFKLINDSLGHAIGDKLLKAVADRFLSCTRAEDTLARVGGDEFILLLVGIKTPEQAEIIARKYLAALASVFHIDNHEIYTRCSIGISIYPNDGRNYKLIVERADVAMYIAKKNQSQLAFYHPTMHQEIVSRLELENELPLAVKKNQLEIYYQPIIDFATQKICGAEALIRWNHPTRGLLMPDDFISAAEEAGVITVIGDWVLKNACLQNKYWREKNIFIGKISINVSIKQLQRPNILMIISDILKSTGLDLKYVQLELTESLLAQDIEGIADLLKQLKTIGVSIAIDDFGVGYSGLGYLKHFPLDTLKIDQSFATDILYNSAGQAIITATIGMCKHLHIRTCMEGVETEEQYQFLRAQGCDEAQGFYFSRPLTAPDFERFVSQ